MKQTSRDDVDNDSTISALLREDEVRPKSNMISHMWVRVCPQSEVMNNTFYK